MDVEMFKDCMVVSTSANDKTLEISFGSYVSKEDLKFLQEDMGFTVGQAYSVAKKARGCMYY